MIDAALIPLLPPEEQARLGVGPHWATCSPDYPEKPAGEAAQERTLIDLDDGTYASVCVDCGAHAIIEKNPTA